MKKITLLLLLLLSVNLYAQKGVNLFSLIAGYEGFPENHVPRGFNVGVEFKHYLNNGFYAVTNFHAGVNNGYKKVKFPVVTSVYENDVREYMLGIGLGADLLQIKKHKIYLQATVGMGRSEESSSITNYDKESGKQDKQTTENEFTRYAVSATAGYDYQVTKWLSLGINYTGWKIGSMFTNSANAKIGFTF